MVGFDHYAHPNRLEVLLEALRDLPSHPLLDLQAPAVEFDQARHLAETDQASFRDVSDVHPAVEREQVVLAQRVHFDVLHHDHVFIGLGKDGVAEDIVQRHPVAASEKLETFLDSLRRVAQAFA